jgi:hypothetical protein
MKTDNINQMITISECNEIYNVYVMSNMGLVNLITYTV